MAHALSVVLFLIGLGSFLFHTLATPWAAAADTLPILLYVSAAHRRVRGQGVGVSLAFALVMIRWIALLTPVLGACPGLPSPPSGRSPP